MNVPIRKLMRTTAAAALLTVVGTGCSPTAGPPSATSARPSPPVGTEGTGAHPIESDHANDPSCAGPQRVESTDLPEVLRDAPENGGQHPRWLGSRDLWINAPSVVTSTAHRVKFGSVTLDAGDRPTDAAGPPEVMAERVDGTGRVRGGTGGYAHHGDDAVPESFWPTVIDFPGPGCWLVTAASSETTLRLLMLVRS